MAGGERPIRSNEPFVPRIPIKKEPDIMGDRPIFASVIEEVGNLPLGDYIQTFHSNPAETPPIDSREDIVDALEIKARALFGQDFAKRLARTTKEIPIFSTGPHAGLMTDPIVTQGAIFTAEIIPDRAVMPVLATNNVPLNNSSVGRGIVLARTRETGNVDAEGNPIRRHVTIPLFERKYSDVLVGYAPPVSLGMIRSGLTRSYDLWKKGEISSLEWEGLQKVFAACPLDLLQEEAVPFDDLAAHWNKKLWKLMFSKELSDRMPELAYFSMEKVLRPAMALDIRTAPDSFISQALFNPSLRNALLEELNGVYGCWDTEKLNIMADKGVAKQQMKDAGTGIFSEIDSTGRAVPLRLTRYNGELILERVQGPKHFAIPFTKDGIAEALIAERINPSLWLSYAFIAFARGFMCVGGTKQTHYLTEAKEKTVKALIRSGYPNWARKAESVPTRPFATSVTFVMAEYEDGWMEPAGTVEIIGRGGLTLDELKRAFKIPTKLAGTLWVSSSQVRRAWASERNNPDHRPLTIKL